MLPTDNEFVILYITYFLLLLFLVGGVILARNKKRYVSNLIFYLIYTGIMASVFFNQEHFKYGGSLAVLFEGGMFVLLHLCIFLFRSGYDFINRKAALNKNFKLK
jgi:hypothetical protein